MIMIDSVEHCKMIAGVSVGQPIKVCIGFTESEYAVPRQQIAPVLRALRAWIDDHDERICIPVQVRVAAPMTSGSTACQRDTGYIAVHQYFKIDYRHYSQPSSRSSPNTRAVPTGASCIRSRLISWVGRTRGLITSCRFGTGSIPAGRSTTPICGRYLAERRSKPEPLNVTGITLHDGLFATRGCALANARSH